jgi:hypothetical protein
VDPSQSESPQYLIAGLPDHEFAVNSDGGLYVSRLLDYEATQFYPFFVIVNDETTAIGTATVNIQVDNVNDNTPLFTMESYTVYFPYSGNPLTVDISSHCSDSDLPPYNALMFQAHMNTSTVNVDMYFSVLSFGAIQRRQDIPSSESSETYTLSVICNDVGLKADTAVYTVIAQELNMGPPVFSTPHTFMVEETNEFNEVVGYVTLTDPNSDDVIDAEISGGATTSFSITKTADYVWQVTYLPKLDRELRPSVSVEITARDGIEGIYRTMTSRQTYTVIVLDINDNTPMFAQNTYQVSIPRSHPVGVPIISPQCSDRDEGNNAEVTYSILTGQQDLFEINTNNGSIFLSSDVDRSRLPTGGIGHHLSIRCADGGNVSRTATAVVAIVVPENNTAAPVLVPSESQTITVLETKPVNSLLIDFDATDADGDEIAFSISHFQVSSTYFSIDNATGTVTLVSSLDYENGPHVIYFTVLATDVAGLSASVFVTVNVMNVDDQPLVFSGTEFSVDVMESNSTAAEPEIRRNFFTVTCTDPDLLTETIRYRLDRVSPAPVGFGFEINPQNGSLSATAEIDYERLDETNSQYQLTVSCYSDEEVSNSTSQAVTVNIVGVNEFKPIFNGSVVFINADESFAIGGVILSFNPEIRGLSMLSLQDDDRGSVLYVTVEGDEEPGEPIYFRFDSDRNVLVTSAALDMDIYSGGSRCGSGNGFCAFNPTVRVCDQPQIDNDRCSSQSFFILVRLRNDEMPMFSMSRYNVTVREDVNIGSVVVPIECTDRDIGEDPLDITIVDSPIDEEVFSVTPTAITNDVGLDYESKRVYSFAVNCSDGLFSASALVYIEVLAVNEFSPVFVNATSQGYTFSISRTANPSSFAGHISIDDADEGEGSDHTYDFTPKDGVFQFVEVSGGVQLLQDLSDRLIPNYTYTLSVSDGDFTNTTTVVINILGGNFHRPLWVEGRGPGVIDVPEREANGTLVHTLECSDADTPDTDSSRISYFITSDESNGNFIVNEMTGEVIVARGSTIPADVSTLTFTIGIKCMDHGDPSKEATGFLYINIIEVPVNPTINISTNGSIELTVREDLQVNDFVSNITTGNFRESGFTCTLDDDLFYVISNHPNCELRVKGELDAEQMQSHRFSMEVTDGLNTIVTNAIVYIQDVNDNRPDCSALQGSMHSVNIDASIGHVIIADLGCTDPDFGPNGLITYTLSNGFFGITPPSSLTVKNSLMTTNPSRVFLQITASDNGTEMMMSTVLQLIVEINAVNTIAPNFTNIPDAIEILESTPIYDIIFTATAVDTDVGYFGEVSYRELSGDPQGYFSVEENGNIRLLRKLDAVDSSFFMLEIEASDTGFVTTGFLNITVTEVNDFSPVCTNDVFYVRGLQEELSTAIFQNVFDCSDDDSGLSGLVTYTTLSGPHTQFINIGLTTGTITIISPVDYELYEVLSVSVSVSDRGDPSRSTNVNVIVVVDPVNEYTPILQNELLEMSVSENAAVGSQVFLLTITDDDRATQGDGQISATLSGDGSSDFELQAVTSNEFEVKIATALDYEARSSYTLTLEATDMSTTAVRSSSSILVVNVLDENDNHPDFSLSLYTGSVETSASIGEEVVTLVCSDTEDEGNVTIELVTSPAFLDLTSNGVIEVSGTLPRSSGLYSFEARCTDMGPPSLSSTVQVSVFVYLGTPQIDFIADSLSATVRESLPVLDPDSRENSLITRIGTVSNFDISYSIPNGSEFFFIESRAGNVRLKKELDYETDRVHTFIVRASLTTNSSVFEESQVQINVINENDNMPVSLNDSVSLQLTEGSHEGLDNVYIVCDDADVGSYGMVTYTLTTETSPNIFGIRESSGEIYFLPGSPPDYETNRAYTLTVTCSDGEFSDSVEVYVEVLPVNEHAPAVTSASTVTVMEGLTIGSRVVRIVSTDADDFPHGTVRYNITRGNEEGIFMLNSESGSLFLLQRLDYEEQTSHTLEIEASDDGEPGSFEVMTTDFTLEIDITDENDNTPMFSQNIYTFSVREDVSTSTTVGTVNCTDLDSGSNSAQRIELANPSVPFQMESPIPLGILKVFGDLSPQPYILNIVCSDSGSDPRSSTALVIVNVEPQTGSINFVREAYLFELTEVEADVNTEIGTITAYDNGTNEFTYSLVSAPANVFNIEITTGRLTLLRDLDYEQEADRSFSFFVEATSTTSGSRRVAVVVSITDVNDGPPTFDSSIYVDKVREALEPPQTVGITVHCTDIDDDANAENSVQYSLVNTTAFSVDPVSGILSTVVELDLETRPEYEFAAICRDSSNQTATASVRVSVDPFNEFTPRFTQEMYSGQVVEGISAFTVATVIATDEDFVKYGTVRYSIVSGNEAGNFDISSTSGAIVIVRALDYEEQSVYTLEVSASDIVPADDTSGSVQMASTATVTITVIDANDVVPIIAPDVVVVNNLQRDSPNNTVATSFACTDGDSGEGGRVSMSLVSGDMGDFILQDGQLITVDTVLLPSYTIKIICEDFGSPPLTSTAVALISPNSTNVNAPRFVNLVDSLLLLPEDLNRTDCLYTVTASDADNPDTPDGMFTFSMVPAVEEDVTYFDIDNDASCIKAVDANQLDLGDRNNAVTIVYQLVVEDKGVPALSTSATIEIKVTANNPPSFPTPVDPVDRKEMIADPQCITSVSCTDMDLNDPLSMTIISGNTGNVFNIVTGPKTVVGEVVSITGSVCINTGKVLDYDQGVRTFTLTVQCSDSRLQTTTTMSVNVLPVNEYPPMFEVSGRFDVPENVYSGYRITTLVAEDNDAGEDGVVKFRFSTPNRLFNIAETGELTMVGPFDFDVGQQMFLLQIEAYDRADSTDISTRRTYVGQVSVYLTNVNDVAPVFPSDVAYSFAVNASAEPNNTIIGTVSCTDGDQNPNTVIQYTLVNDVKGLFAVNSTTGEVLVGGDLYQRDFDNYVLLVECSDNGYPILSSVTEVAVTVQEQNMFPPQFVTVPSGALSVSELFNLTSVIFTFNASDADEGAYGRLTYSLNTTSEESGIFTIDPNMGQLKLLRMLDHETQTQHILDVIVTDGLSDSSNRMSATSQVTISVLDENEHTPQCTQPFYIGYFQSTTPLNDVLVTLNCTDDDIYDVLSYTQGQYTEGSTQPFSLVGSTIEYNGNTPHTSADDYYRFSVRVSDGKKSTTVNITIATLFTNDHSPNFTLPSYSIDVTEDAALGSSLYTFTAEDSDRGLQGEVTYSLSGRDAGEFSINQATGELLLADSLDTETRPELYIEVVGTDGDPFDPRSTSVNVTVSVTDVNDNAPFCDPSYLTVPILSGTESNTVIGTLMCQDNDRLLINRQLTFSLSPDTLDHPFDVSSSTGEILTSGELTPSTSYFFTVVVSDTGTPSLSSEVDVVVEVYRENQAPPMFDRDVYHFTIDETIEILSVIGQLTVTDEDSSAENFRFNITESNSDFHVDFETGLVRVIAPMDYEQDRMFMFTVQVQDGGSYNGANVLTATTTVNISVVNINDHEPELSGSGIYGTTVNVTTGIGQTVLEFSCSDEDVGVFGEVSVTHDPLDIPFDRARIGQTDRYRFFVKSDLTEAGGISYTANITCTDDLYTTQGQIFIAVLHPGDPVFAQIVYQWDVAEDAPLGSNYTDISANTNSGTSLTYSITSGNDNGLFRIDPDSAALSLAFSLDYEEQRRHGLVIRATDGNGNFSEVLVIVNVLDVSEDSDLVPPSGSYTVAHSHPIGEPFGNLRCTNGTVRRGDRFNFTFVPASTTFSTDDVGNLRLLHQLDETPAYVLPVYCYNFETPEQVANGIVNIRVIFENKYTPAFDLSTYNVLLPEDHNISDVATTVVARDSDIGSFGEIEYRIQSGNTGNKFFVNSTTGELRLLSTLDYETLQNYNLTVIAVDGGTTAPNSKRNTGTTTVSVTVQDVNDNAPVFSEDVYNAAILTDHGLLEQVLNVSCSDADSGNNMIVDYSIRPESQKFAIDGNTIVLREEIESEDVYVLDVVCTDRGRPALSSTSQAIIIVSPVDVGAPQFNQTSYSTTINEDHPILGDFYQVTATPANPTIDVSYSIVGGDGMDTFGIEAHSGTVFTLNRLNAVQKSQYYIIVSASNVGTNALSSMNVTVRITVLDVNDNAPIFTPGNYYRGSVEETAITPTTVTTVTCEDSDAAENAVVSYNVISVSTLFDVNSEGVVFVNGRLDYERSVEHTIMIRCQDSGSPPQSSTATVVIRVLPINEHAPVFVNDSYTFEGVLENTAFGESVGSVSAVDSDNGIDGSVSYRLADNGLYSSFQVNSLSGEITVSRSLDFEAQSEHRLIVIAEDNGGLTGTADVVITLSDINDNNPVLFPTAAVVELQINTSIPSNIQRFECTDQDTVPSEGTTISIASDTSNGNFELRQDSMLIVNRIFASPGLHTVKLSCVDPGGRAAIPQAVVAVTVYETRDLIPRFQPSNRYEVDVPEGSHTSQFTTTVIATSQTSGTVSYRIHDGDSRFTIESSTGRLFVNGSLDVSVQKVHNVIVSATANGHSSLAVVVVSVQDVNDNTPQMTIPEDVSVRETVQPPSALTTIFCDDDDEGSNGETVVSLTDNTFAGLFAVTPGGVLSLVGSVDYDMGMSLYNISLTCSDRGADPRTVSGFVSVVVEPVNEYPPVFDPSVYTKEISENATLAESFLSLNITDDDAGKDGQFSVRISSEVGSSDFAVINSRRDLAVDRHLNATTRSSYTLELVATDFGLPTPQTGFAEASITVSDLNEQPYFSEQSYSFVLSEEASLATPVGDVTCRDGDIGSNANLNITLVETGDHANFVLLSVSSITGTSVARVFTDTFPITSDQELTVRCSDGGDPSMSTSMSLRVTIIPVNLNPPVFTNLPRSVTVGELDDPPVRVFTVRATDVETPSRLTYEIVSGNVGSVFTLNPNTGELTLVDKVDYELEPSYNLLFRVYDGSPVNTLQAEDYLFVNLTNINDVSPDIDGSNAFSVQEQDSTESLAKYTCEDGDGFLVQFSIEGDVHNQFTIDANSGDLILSRPLDYETAPSHSITVVCTDRPSPLAGVAQSATIDVIVTVMAINAYPPQFENSMYIFNVSENTNVGSPVSVGRILATDPDNRQNAQIKYTIVERDPDLPIFSLDSVTGELFLVSFVDRETDPEFHLVVRADDGDTIAGSRTSTVNVTVKITDINDNTPTCTNETYVHLLYEGQYDNFVLSALECQDIDAGQNGNLTYTIESRSISGGVDFVWDTTRGAVTLTGTVHPGVLDLAVLVSDQGSPSLSVRVQVILNIVVNDTVSLRFIPAVFSVDTQEDSEIGYSVANGSMFRNALRFGTQMTPTFSLISTMEISQFFSVEESTGNVVLQRNVDYESRTEYGLVISAYDGNYTAFCSLIVEIVDVNDNPPVFVQSNFGIVVDEESRQDNVTHVHADDVDTGLGGVVVYEFATDSEFFAINPNTGEISVVEPIDHELYSRLLLQVVARDLGDPQYSSSIFINVTVRNINDNVPRFNSTQYLAYMTNSDPVGTVLVKLAATDDDNLLPLTFSITSTPCPDSSLPPIPEARTLFDVEDSTQELRLIQSLPETNLRDLYYFTVLVSDGDHIGETCVQIVVRTVTLLEAVVLEGEPFSYNLTLRVKERGINVPDSTQYTIIDGNVDDAFDLQTSLSSYQSVVNVNPLDREYLPEYRLFIDLVDASGLNVTILLRITVQDVNDNPPVFEQDRFMFSVAEGPRSDSGPLFIAQLHANDDDILLNGFVTYYFAVVEDPSDVLSTVLFTLDSSSGNLSLLGILDRESVGEHQLLVRAVDAGNPTMSAEAVVTIDVTDINDNSPVFLNPVTSASILPGSQPGTPLISLTATDADLGANGEIDFAVSVNNPRQLFRVDESKRKRAAGGNVPYIARIVANDVIVEEYTNLEVTVTASDRGASSTPISLMFTLLVRNTEPAFTSDVYTAQVLMGEQPPAFVLSVSATDKDGQTVTYKKQDSGSNNAPFAVSRDSGAISVVETIPLDWPHKYYFEVVAEDTNSPDPGSSTASVVVNIYNTSHIVIVESCNEEVYWMDADNKENARRVLEERFNQNGLAGSVFIHSTTKSEVEGVLSELQVFLIVGEFYQNWTSPDITTAAVAQAATKSFVEGAKLHSNLISFPKLDLPLCFLGSRIIEVPTPPPPTEESTLSPTLIAVIVVVLFLFIALCIMVACICCYCYYARKDKKEADKNYFVGQRLAVDQYGWAGVDQIDPDFMPLDPNMNLLYQESPEDFNETDFAGYPPYPVDPRYYNQQVHSFGEDTHASLPMETEESSVTSLESGGNFQMGPFLEAVMNKWEESEQVLSKDRKKHGRRH